MFFRVRLVVFVKLICALDYNVNQLFCNCVIYPSIILKVIVGKVIPVLCAKSISRKSTVYNITKCQDSFHQQMHPFIKNIKC